MTDFAAWRAGFAARHPALAAYLPADLAPLPEVAAQAAAQAEFTLSAARYIARAMPAARIADGRAAFARHRALLTRLRAETGVPGEIICAIWGVETDFGRIRGDLPVLAALATLAHGAPRRAYFETELIAALALIAAGRAAPGLTGSWAGASGHCQFMPSAVQKFARTSDRTPLDIWSDDPTGGLTAIVLYLSAHGWQAGASWLTETAPDHPETLLIPAGLPGPAFRTGPNFQVLLSYNRATLYALAVGLLAHAIAGRPIPETWPDRPALSRAELRELQAILTANGHDTRGTDGLIGPDTRAAIRAWQKAHNLPADGFASRALLLHLSENTPGVRGLAPGPRSKPGQAPD